ncbi:MAG: hypothetical protein A2X08_04160 [Bacteroidetes bacterium GWA2_32_17]|nr:MAG: hypothetical protein A2X08_04160 [Bacteroidetes bacterium GWA2_32_17]
MEEQIQKSNAGKGLGIAAFVIAVVGIVISFIPCLGMYGLVPCGIALILAIIAFIQAKKANASKGLIIAALVISIVGTSIASWQLYVLMNAKSFLETDLKDAVEKIDIKSLNDELNDAMNESMDSLGSSVDQMQQGLDSVKTK